MSFTDQCAINVGISILPQVNKYYMSIVMFVMEYGYRKECLNSENVRYYQYLILFLVFFFKFENGKVGDL